MPNDTFRLQELPLPGGLPLLLTENAAAKALSISPRALWELAANSKIQVVRIGRAKRYRVADLEDFVKALAKKEGKAEAANQIK